LTRAPFQVSDHMKGAGWGEAREAPTRLMALPSARSSISMAGSPYQGSIFLPTHQSDVGPLLLHRPRRSAMYPSHAMDAAALHLMSGGRIP
jgi:hypothetical protein